MKPRFCLNETAVVLLLAVESVAASTLVDGAVSTDEVSDEPVKLVLCFD